MLDEEQAMYWKHVNNLQHGSVDNNLLRVYYFQNEAPNFKSEDVGDYGRIKRGRYNLHFVLSTFKNSQT